jgi:hypothetical protein
MLTIWIIGGFVALFWGSAWWQAKTATKKVVSAGTATGRTDKKAVSAGTATGRTDKKAEAAGVATGRTDKTAEAAGTATGRTDKTAEVAGTVLGRVDKAGEVAGEALVRTGGVIVAALSAVAETAGQASARTDASAMPKASAISKAIRATAVNADTVSPCPGGLGAVLNYGILAQTFFAHWMLKHEHMGFDWTIEQNEAEMFGIGWGKDPDSSFDVKTGDSRLWINYWKEPPPPCKNLNSDLWNSWKRDGSRRVFEANWELGQHTEGVEPNAAWELWRIEDVVTVAAHIRDAGIEAVTYSFYSQYSAKTGTYEVERFAGGDAASIVTSRLAVVQSMLDTLEAAGRDFSRRSYWWDDDTNRRVLRWVKPSWVEGFSGFRQQELVRFWNRAVMLEPRWAERFILRDTASVLESHGADFSTPWDRKPEQFDKWSSAMQVAENYLMNGRWLVWATLMYLLAYHRGNSAKVPDWWINHCSSWGVPVPRPGRDGRSISKDGNLNVDRASIPDSWHGSGGDLDRLLRHIRMHTPVPGSLSVREMNGKVLLNWRNSYTGSFRPLYTWPREWIDVIWGRTPTGTDWGQVIFDMVYDLVGSVVGSGIAAEVGPLLDTLVGELAASMPAVLQEAVGKLATQLIAYVGRAAKIFFTQGPDAVATWDPMNGLKLFAAAASGEFLKMAQDTEFSYGVGGVYKNFDQAYSAFKSQWKSQTDRTGQVWGPYTDDLFGLIDVGESDAVKLLNQKLPKI